jgi:hypothetical protein
MAGQTACQPPPVAFQPKKPAASLDLDSLELLPESYYDRNTKKEKS